MKERKKRGELHGAILTVGLAFLFTLLLIVAVEALPSGPTALNITSNETATTTAAQVVNISGGYIATLNVTAVTQNTRWKAFVGEVDGRFTLNDASGSIIYDWSLSSISGEVYATRASSAISWTEVGCADAANITAEDTALVHTGEDNITSTFTAANNSETFNVGGNAITATSCYALHTYINNQSQGADFEEVILADGSSNLIFTTILEEDVTGFDGNTYDFQMIVPENASTSFSSSTAYYVYVQLV
jgi:hypothetical protein